MIEASNLPLNEPKVETDALFFEDLNLISFFLSSFVFDDVVGESVSSFKSSKVKKSENCAVLNFLESFRELICQLQSSY